jgi:hypothetical protein
VLGYAALHPTDGNYGIAVGWVTADRYRYTKSPENRYTLEDRQIAESFTQRDSSNLHLYQFLVDSILDA